jgi:hypothetical protein
MIGCKGAWVIGMALVVGAMAGCSELLLGTGSAGAVEVRVDPGGVAITNRTADPVGYTVFDSDLAAVAIWSPCVTPECPWIQPRESVRVPAQDVWEWKGGEALIVFWWHARPSAAGTWAADSIRAIRVPY